MKRTVFISAAILSLLAAPALAHTGHTQTSSLMSGFSHPFLGLDHILAMLAVGLLAAQSGGKSRFALPGLFVTLMLVGGAFGMSALTLPFAEQGIIGSVIILGAVVALGHRLPKVIAGLLVGSFAVVHGVAHGAEMPVDAAGFTFAAGFALSTAVLVGSGLTLAVIAQTIVPAAFTAITHRVTGATLAIAGLGLAAV